MRPFPLPLTMLAVMFLVSMHASPAQAQLKQVWVSPSGNDMSCSGTVGAPCRSFAGALTKIGPGGEITCLGSGDYGGVTITQSVTINCEGAIGSNAAPTGGIIDTFTISGTAPTDTVTLRGLYFDAAGSTTLAVALIRFTGAGVLHIEKSKIGDFPSSLSGIAFTPSGPAKLFVSDSSITNIGTSGLAAAINIKPASGVTANVTIERSQINNNYFGIIADGTAGGTIRGLVSDSVVSGNIHNGITVASSGTNVVLAIDNVKVAGNNFGLVATGTNAGMLVRRSFITGNATGLFTASGGVLLSYRDNSLNGNTTTDGVFTGPVGLQ